MVPAISDASGAATAVLDSNVLVSLLVFADPRYPGIAAAWKAGRLQVVCDEACAAEFRRVLAYSKLKLTATRQSEIFTAFESLTRPFRQTAANGAVTLPKCQDADDQKFLELALARAADFLVTGDSDLLKLRRGARALPFSIVTADELERRLSDHASRDN